MTIEELTKITKTLEQKINRKKSIDIIQEIKNKQENLQTEAISPNEQTIIKGDFLFGTKYIVDEEEYYFWFSSYSGYAPPCSIASGKKEGTYIYTISKSQNKELKFSILDSNFHSIYNQLDVYSVLGENELNLIQKATESIQMLNQKLLNPIY